MSNFNAQEYLKNNEEILHPCSFKKNDFLFEGKSYEFSSRDSANTIIVTNDGIRCYTRRVLTYVVVGAVCPVLNMHMDKKFQCLHNTTTGEVHSMTVNSLYRYLNVDGTIPKIRVIRRLPIAVSLERFLVDSAKGRRNATLEYLDTTMEKLKSLFESGVKYIPLVVPDMFSKGEPQPVYTHLVEVAL